MPSFWDGIFNGLGYGLVLVTLGTVREILGSGTLWKMQIIPASFYEHGYLNNGLMVLPPAALILVGVMIWVQRAKMN
jgi:Na+-transporting NADH:ubiquinone oxidoreductase subunit D